MTHGGTAAPDHGMRPRGGLPRALADGALEIGAHRTGVTAVMLICSQRCIGMHCPVLGMMRFGDVTPHYGSVLSDRPLAMNSHAFLSICH